MAGASLSPGLRESVQMASSPYPTTKTLSLMLSTHCPGVSRLEPQATHEILPQPILNSGSCM